MRFNPSNRTVEVSDVEGENGSSNGATAVTPLEAGTPSGTGPERGKALWQECCDRRLTAGIRNVPFANNVLLVEPNLGEARRITALVRGRSEQRLHVVDRLHSARERLKRGDIDVVLLDLDLPDSRGLATLEAVVETCPRAAIIVVGGAEEEDLGAKAVRQGAQDYLRKSQLQPDLLQHAIRYAHERKSLENEHAQVERELGLIGRLTRMSAQAETFDAALEELLEEVCVTTGWVAGESWIPSRSGDRLVRGPTFNSGSEVIDGFHESSATLELGPGEGIAGEVWKTRAAIWAEKVEEVPAFCRLELARLTGLRSVMMIPVLAGDEVAAVLGFFHTRPRPKDQRLIDFLTAAAAQLGAVLQRRRAEEALRRSESRMRQLMDTANDGICVLGAEGGIRYINERGAMMLASTPAALLGQPARTVFGSEAVAAPASRTLGRSRLYRETRELCVTRPDGAELWLLISTSPIYGSGGVLDGSLLMMTDVTTLKRTEQGERILAEFGRASGSSLDPSTTLETLVRAIEPELAESCVVLAVEDSDLRVAAGAATDPELDRLFRVAAAGRVRGRPKAGGALETVLQSREGAVVTHPRPEEGAAALPPVPNGDLLGLLDRRASLVVPIETRAGVAGLVVIGAPKGGRTPGRHLTALAVELGRRAGLALENARLYQQAKAAIRARDDFLGVVAHDLRNPLGAVSMYATMIGEGTGTEEDRRTWSAAIRRSAGHMNRLIQDLLDVTKIEAGTLRIEKTPTPVGGLIHEVVEMFASDAEKQQVEIRNDLPPDTRVEAAVDRTRMVQVLANLVGNALKFTPAGGTISIGVEVGDAEIRFEVRDTGTGIAPEAVDRVFDRFWQAPDAPKSGAGLGLTIAHGIVQAHGGRIWAESTLGSGTTFRFTIPMEEAKLDAASAPTVAPAAGTSAVPAGSPLRLLIADDHEIFRRSLEELLNATGRFEVVAGADSGEKAVEQARLLRPDLVVMDLEMPGRGGLWAIEQITALPFPVPVLVLTGDTHDEMILRAMEVGANGYVRKHVEPDALIDAIDAVARGELGVDARANRLLAESYRRKRHADAESPLADLSEAERMIVQLAAAGFNSREIGKQLYLSSKTVDTYRSKLMRRLGLRHRSDLVHFAIKHGLLRAEPGNGAG